MTRFQNEHTSDWPRLKELCAAYLGEPTEPPRSDTEEPPTNLKDQKIRELKAEPASSRKAPPPPRPLAKSKPQGRMVAALQRFLEEDEEGEEKDYDDEG